MIGVLTYSLSLSLSHTHTLTHSHTHCSKNALELARRVAAAPPTRCDLYTAKAKCPWCKKILKSEGHCVVSMRGGASGKEYIALYCRLLFIRESVISNTINHLAGQPLTLYSK